MERQALDVLEVKLITILSILSLHTPLFASETGLQSLRNNRTCLAITLFKEAHTEPLRGKRAVLDVLHTRMKQKRKSCYKVVTEKGQFSFNIRKVALTRKMLTDYDNVAKMLPVAAGYTHFTKKSVKIKWQKRARKSLSIGKHKFFLIEKEV